MSHPLGNSQDEEHSLASVAYLTTEFPHVNFSQSFPCGDHACADAGTGTALSWPAATDGGKGPVASFVPSSSWPGLQGPSTVGCKVASCWWYFLHSCGAELGEQLLVFVQPICVGSPHCAHDWWFHISSISGQLCLYLSCSPS